MLHGSNWCSLHQYKKVKIIFTDCMQTFFVNLMIIWCEYMCGTWSKTRIYKMVISAYLSVRSGGLSINQKTSIFFIFTDCMQTFFVNLMIIWCEYMCGTWSKTRIYKMVISAYLSVRSGGLSINQKTSIFFQN